MSIEHSQLQARFEDQVTSFERVRGFIEKCHALTGSYSPKVIAKVVSDYESQSLEIVGAIMLIQPDVEEAVEALRDQRDTIERSVASSKLALEELELRLAIGEIEQEDYDSESDRFTGDVEAADQQFLLIDHDLDAYEELLVRWSSAGEAAGVLKAA